MFSKSACYGQHNDVGWDLRKWSNWICKIGPLTVNYPKLIRYHFDFDACSVHSPFGFVRALFCLDSLAKVNTQRDKKEKKTKQNNTKQKQTNK